ncbi:MAG TPA: carboxymuconolactone decarboxylase family protein [Hyphomicrobiales bacterium]|nr:carboxymuconolactone decarboxylase family protein [Rhodobiaceae bacterium]HXK54972.1 carboxymuconolactone decarboxylase family protein [Hyphomicrobiales bacterium]
MKPKSGSIVAGLGAGLAVLAALGAPPPVRAQDMAGAEATYKDIEATLGAVPGFFKLFPAVGVAGAWAEFKSIQLNPETRLSGKEKELIGLAVAAQIPCTYCIYFHTKAALANGATAEEVKEAVAMAAITRHWSTVLNGMQVDLADFSKQTDELMAMAEKKAAQAGKAK